MILDLTGWPIELLFGGLLLTAVTILIFGAKLAARADEIADLTGLGEAIIGAILLGATTSLPGIIVSVVAAAYDHPELAIANAIGGIAAQTAFLALADIAYRRANLEHAAASIGNIVQGALLVSLLSIPLAAFSLPAFSIFGISPATPILIAGYIYGQRIVSKVLTRPMWRPTSTPQTFEDQADEEMPQQGSWSIGLQFAAFALITAVAGLLLGELAVEISAKTGLAESAAGGIVTAVVSSLPELVTSVAAVRRGALTLAVGGIIGGNTYDVLFLALADIGYLDGSIYDAFLPVHVFSISVTILMTGIILIGMLRRQEYGPGGIGFESLLVLLLYSSALVAMALSGYGG